MAVCLCRKCRHRSVVNKGSFPGVCPNCNYILTAAMIVDESEGVELILRNYCVEKGINPDGQFIEQDGYLFLDGYEIGRKAGLETRRLHKPSRLLDINIAAAQLLRVALDNVDDVHPCDIDNDEVKVKRLSPEFQALYKAIHQ